jgi:hypothetical protein
MVSASKQWNAQHADKLIDGFRLLCSMLDVNCINAFLLAREQSRRESSGTKLSIINVKYNSLHASPSWFCVFCIQSDAGRRNHNGSRAACLLLTHRDTMALPICWCISTNFASFTHLMSQNVLCLT